MEGTTRTKFSHEFPSLRAAPTLARRGMATNSFVSVDNTDPSIIWNGPWFSVQGKMDDYGGGGPPFLGTLQGITTNGSFSFLFRGTGVSVWGSTTAHESAGIPAWSCLCDGKPDWILGPDQSKARISPESPLCAFSYLSNDNHTLVLNSTFRSEIFWVDRIQYRASLDTDISSSWIAVDLEDSRYRYSGEWKKSDLGMETWTKNASFTYEFNGKEAILGGYRPRDGGAALDGLATYSLDLGPPVEFIIPASGWKTNQPYFNISTMEPGDHHLEVVNKGNSSTAPLAFSYIYAKNSPMQAPDPSNTSGLPDVPTEPAAATQPSGVKRGFIGGAVGGGLALILLATLLSFLYIRKRRREQAHLATVLTPSAFDAEASQRTITVVPDVVSRTDLSGPPNVPAMRGLVSAPPAAHHKSSPLIQLPPPMQPLDTLPVSPQLPRSHTPPPSYAAL